MCGITGFIAPFNDNRDGAESTIRRMKGCLLHRGPDDGGEYIDGDSGVVLGHQRLSVLDLTPSGHQPMHSGSGRFVMVFNGECYNHAQLRADLAGRVSWRGTSDTETVLAMIEDQGVEHTLQRMIGMFAFALWDRSTQRLTLARDRMGEKPLYYGWQGNAFLFGSELKAIREHPQFEADIDRGALAVFLRHGYVPGPHCIFRGMAKLPPAHMLTIRADHVLEERPGPQPYWSLRDVIARGRTNGFSGTATEAADELERLLSAAITDQRIADVPLGAFLSGGIDSSLVTSLMQAQSAAPVRTFTIGFHETGFNEAEHAAAIAQHLGTHHTELYVTSRDVRDIIPSLPHIYDEPFGDASALPTHILARLARDHVTVALSGDGGDELFFGYGRYLRIAQLHRKLGRMPPGLRVAAGTLIAGVEHMSPALQLVPGAGRWLPPVRRKARRAAAILRTDSVAALYRSLVSHWDDAEQVVLGATELSTAFHDTDRLPGDLEAERVLMYLDYCTILPEDILSKVDRAAMAVSLETRVPFLDHRVVEFAQSLPLEYMYAGGDGKLVVRDVLRRHVPAHLWERPKQGFSVPIAHWLRGPLREWAEELLDERRLREEGFFDTRLLRRRWLEYVDGGATWEYQIWDALMFQAWHEALRSAPAAAAA